MKYLYRLYGAASMAIVASTSDQIDGIVQERHNSSVLAMELRLLALTLRNSHSKCPSIICTTYMSQDAIYRNTNFVDRCSLPLDASAIFVDGNFNDGNCFSIYR